jgi:thioredoxin-related protein
MEKMLKSKTFLIVVGLVIIFLAAGLSLFFIFNSNPKTYKEITYSELEELIDSGDKFILFIGSNSCSHCTVFKVAVNEVVSDYGVIVNYIDLANYLMKNMHI